MEDISREIRFQMVSMRYKWFLSSPWPTYLSGPTLTVDICHFLSATLQYCKAYSLEKVGVGSLERWVHWGIISHLSITQICDLSIREYKANVKPGARKDSLSTIIASRHEDGTGMTHEDLVSLAFILIVGGSSTNFDANLKAPTLPGLRSLIHPMNWQGIPNTLKSWPKSSRATRMSTTFNQSSLRNCPCWMRSSVKHWECIHRFRRHSAESHRPVARLWEIIIFLAG